MLMENALKPPRERLTVIRIFEACGTWAMRAATTRCGATPNAGAAARCPARRCQL